MRGPWSEHEARAVLGAWKKSGLALEAFAKARGLVPQRLRWWKQKLEGRADGQAIAMLPVQVTAATAANSNRGEPIAVFLRSGHVVKVGRGFDEEAFARVVAILEGA